METGNHSAVWSDEQVETKEGIEVAEQKDGTWAWVVKKGFLEEVTTKPNFERWTRQERLFQVWGVSGTERRGVKKWHRACEKLITGRSERNKRPFAFLAAAT